MMHQDITNIWNQFNKELLRFINSKVKNEDIANDILQEVFIKIHQNISKLKDKDKLVSWVYNITRNSINDYFRSNKKSKLNNVALDEIEEFISDNSFEEKDKLDEDTKLQISKCLIPFINQLNEESQFALKSTVISGVSQKDLANNLGISYSTLKSRVQRAKSNLFNMFVSCCNVHLDSRGNLMDFESKENCKCGCNDTNQIDLVFKINP